MNKHTRLTKIATVALALILLVSCLPVMSVFAAESGNPTTVATKTELPADFTWLIVIAAILAILIAIMLVILLKTSKKKQRIQRAQQ